MKKIIITTVLTLAFTLVLCATLFACDKKGDDKKINYAIDNSFVVLERNVGNALVFSPVTNATRDENGKVTNGNNLNCEYGVILYVGMGIEPERYSYLATALAKQGYLVVIPQLDNNLAYTHYKADEKAFETYPDVKFFIAGHSFEGGASAIRRTSENKDKVMGTVLFAPVGSRHKLLDENGEPVKDDNGIEIYVADNLLDCSLPVLLVEADNDKVRTQDKANDAKARLKDGYVSKVLKESNHTAFAQIDVEDDLPIKFLPNFTDDVNATTIEQKNAQRTETCTVVLAFLRSVVLG